MSIAANLPSGMMRLLQWVVRTRILRRGYGWLLKNTPESFWGGRDLNVRTDVGEMVLSVKDPGCTGILLFGKIMHEVREGAYVERLAHTCRVMLDVGANVGWYSLLMYRGMKGKGRVCSFEPNPETFAYLHQNVAGMPGIVAFRAAVRDSLEPVTFYCAESSNLSSTVMKVGVPVTVDSVTIDAVCGSNGTTELVDFVKCDVEGAEISVLQGARAVRRGSTPIWMMEVDEEFLKQSGSSAEDMMRELFQAEYGPTHLFYLDGSGKPREIRHVSERKCASNVFIVPERRLEQFQRASESREE